MRQMMRNGVAGTPGAGCGVYHRGAGDPSGLRGADIRDMAGRKEGWRCRPGRWGLASAVDDGGLKATFLEQQPMLRRLLVARLGTPEDADDALQDMWLRIDQLSQRPVAQPVAFLYRVAANLATDMRISASRRAMRETAWLDDQPDADAIPDPERTLTARSEWQAVEGVIANMPERMATALRMFRIEGQSQRAIAERLGITVSGVEKLLQRAYRQLNDRLAGSGVGRADVNRLG